VEVVEAAEVEVEAEVEVAEGEVRRSKSEFPLDRVLAHSG